MRSAMGKAFDSFRIMLQEKSFEDFFRNSSFGHFLDLPKKNNVRFQMSIVYELLKRRFIFQNPEKKDEVLINYCDMPLFFGIREFAIVLGLKCHPPSEPIPQFIVKNNPKDKRKEKKKTSKEQSTDERDLVSFVGPSFKNPQLIYLLTDKDTPKKHKDPCAYFEEGISSPRILRWLRAKNVKNPPDLFNPPHDAELQMPYLITLGLVETLINTVADRVKMELAGATTIKRERVDNALIIFYGVDVGGGIDAGVGVDVGGGIGAGVIGQDQGATFCRRCSSFLCEKCKKQDEDSIMYLQTLSQTVNEF
ncbi:hypothetical protein R3W88_024421 [Solanum pinnatisectum]|uniref:DUF1985 domain-containing protein n=1 Tax=Solanum pinnatisectum TaxID=50273 RepID=A0AAV9M159_9SOLN|nr:hypothetical protein R3W88_024421 [Solanum pinnatisectum]